MNIGVLDHQRRRTMADLDKALRMAIEWLDNQQLGYSGHSVRKACQEALAETQEPRELTDVELSLLAEKYTGADGLDVVDYGRAIMQAYKEKLND
jgi:hypothetical protein